MIKCWKLSQTKVCGKINYNSVHYSSLGCLPRSSAVWWNHITDRSGTAPDFQGQRCTEMTREREREALDRWWWKWSLAIMCTALVFFETLHWAINLQVKAVDFLATLEPLMHAVLFTYIASLHTHSFMYFVYNTLFLLLVWYTLLG